MCINSYRPQNNSLEVENLSTEELNLLKSIYSSIEDNNTENLKEFTKKLIDKQDIDNIDKIKFLEEALNNFN
ncbi:hypothetical protein [Paraclostridium sordellii]|uniref:hypothetical protein n=1 Tax=Paraclostridium sordellii TaxID=1505 RepID=UPI0005E53272|nr:hypothetical protein [Paeniclostridium sordellii]CEO08841.1 Uncharacterised protein [[Clostridium] sordellii] [Paeniclostridium sordellii]CEP87358.1 Uncharacterised protein [[Clostridium] sordellii] [Paeniclostridium sordellii]CEP95700.1 Uncharacterised protein [[Clostridium] sordellii] [Paeniclostridium sordellii]CEP98961.1 Uncharacterised protein [[Clostridium] sordellii] [Paeniclostridium sordellii]